MLIHAAPVSAQTDPGADEITLVMWNDPPDIVFNAGKISGSQADFILEVLKRAKLPFSLHYGSFKNGFDELTHNPKALGIGVVRSVDRENKLHWILRTAHSAELFVTLNGTPGINSFEEARGAKAIVVEKYTYWNLELRRRGFANLVEVYEGTYSARILHSRRADAWFTDAETAKLIWINNGFEPDDLHVGKTVAFDDTYMVSHRDFPEVWLTAILDAAKAMEADGTLALMSSDNRLQVLIPAK